MRTKVYIQGPYGADYVRLFLARGDFEGCKTIADADLVCFTGGSDVDPSLYHEEPVRETYFDMNRDLEDMEAYYKAEKMCIPMVGICRGGQFLNVMNGGRMWQHVDGHTTQHFIIDKKSGGKIWATSTHHQMMIPAPEAEVVAIACPQQWQNGLPLILEDNHLSSICRSKKSDGVIWERDGGVGDLGRTDHEVLFYEATQSLCFQPHPEMISASDSLKDYFFSLLNRFDMTMKDNIACAV